MTGTTHRIHRIVVGVDGSPASIEAVRWAATYATLTDAELEAVTSWTAPGASGLSLGIGYDAVDVDWPAIAKQTQETALSEALPEGSGEVLNSVVFDHPAAALLAAAEGADLLVVGSRGHGGFSGMLLGSISAHVVAHAPCPVVVIRHSAERARSSGDRANQANQLPSAQPATPVLASSTR